MATKARSRKPKSKTPAKSAAAPEAAVEMKVQPEVWATIRQFQARAEFILTEIGRIRVRESAAISEVNAVNQQMNALIAQERERLGIPEGAQWRVSAEGDVTVGPEAEG